MLTPENLKEVFQSTLPRGERLPYRTFQEVEQPISIHAPARGATLPLPLLQPTTVNFNPRSREGSDVSLIEV